MRYGVPEALLPPVDLAQLAGASDVRRIVHDGTAAPVGLIASQVESRDAELGHKVPVFIDGRSRRTKRAAVARAKINPRWERHGGMDAGTMSLPGLLDALSGGSLATSE